MAAIWSRSAQFPGNRDAHGTENLIAWLLATMLQFRLLLPVLLASVAFSQTTMLSYRPAAAEFSAALDRIILISGNPSALHIYSPASGQDKMVSLVKTPLSLSVSPDGLHAAVGHDALVSYVNLSSGTVEKTFTVPAKADGVVLSSSWIYILPTEPYTALSVNIATGAITSNNSVLFSNGSGERLNPAVNAIYGTRDGTSPNDVEEYDISTGPITRQFDSPYHGDYCIYGPVWFSPDGSRIYTGCGTMFHASKDPQVDMYYYGTLDGISSIGALAESAASHRIALIQGNPMIYPPPKVSDGTVTLLDSTSLKQMGQFVLPGFNVNGQSYQAHGKWVFFNTAGTELDVLMEADSSSGLLNDFALQRIPMTIANTCGAFFGSSSVTAPAIGMQGTVQITAASSCVYQATASATWVQIVSGGSGAGSGTLTFTVALNPDPASRTGVISMGSQRFTIVQNGNSSSGPVTPLGYNVIDAAYDKPLDKLILVSASPDALRIYDPVAKSSRTVPLAKPPLSVSVRPDGAYAAVGHDGSVSYVNLQTGSVEKTFQVVTDVHALVLAGNGYVYLFPRRDWSDMYSLQISSGTVTATDAIYDGRVPRLSVDGKSLYVGGQWYSKWDISGGVAKFANQNYSISGTCGNLWLTEDGRRAFTACAKAYTTSDIPAQDMQYNGTLSAASSLVWADESSRRQQTAVIPTSGYNPTNAVRPGDTQVQLYGDAYLAYSGAISLPPFNVGGQSFAAHGRFVFWNRAASALYVVVQGDTTVAQAGSGVVQLAPSSATQATVSNVVNAASNAPGPIAAGELITITGSGIGPNGGVQFGTGPVTTNLAGTQVFFDGTAAPIIYTSATQVKAIVPYQFAYATQTKLQVVYQGVVSAETPLAVAAAAPGVFTINGTGTGQAVALNADGTFCDAAHPAARGSNITVYFTGGGAVSPSGNTGGLNGPTGKPLTQKVEVTVGGQAASVSSAGTAPMSVDGIGQLIVRVADNTPRGSAQPLVVKVGDSSSPATATIAVK